MIRDPEIREWQQEWQDAAPIASDLRKRVEHHSRMMRLMLVSEVLVTVVIGGGTTAWAVRSGERPVAVLAVAVWIFIAIAWGFGLWNRRGLWVASDATTAAFLELAIRRCQSRLNAARFAGVCYAVILMFDLAWVYQYLAVHESMDIPGFLVLPPMILVYPCTAVFYIVLALYRRRTEREFRYLVAMEDSRRIGTPVVEQSLVAMACEGIERFQRHWKRIRIF
jgi:hypothetical protein